MRLGGVSHKAELGMTEVDQSVIPCNVTFISISVKRYDNLNNLTKSALRLPVHLHAGFEPGAAIEIQPGIFAVSKCALLQSYFMCSGAVVVWFHGCGPIPCPLCLPTAAPLQHFTLTVYFFLRFVRTLIHLQPV